MAGTATTLVVRSSSDIAAITELEQILLGEKAPPDVVDDPEQISREIMAQLLAAESDEELESMGKAAGWRELEGIPMEIHAFSWRPSSFNEGAPVFFVVRATRLDDGSKVVLTTGSKNVLAQLANMAKRETLVGAIRELVRAETPTAQGFYPLWLRTPEGAAAPASNETGPTEATA